MTTTAAPEDSWVSISQAAEQLQVHPRTLRRYIKEERLSVLRLSPQVVRIRPEELDRFRKGHLKIITGTGTSYVPRSSGPVEVPTGSLPTAAAPARFSHG